MTLSAMRLRRTLVAYLFLAPYLCFFCVFIVVPLIGGFLLSFVEWELISARPPVFIGLRNFQEALASEYLWKAMYATFKFVVLIVPSTVCLALLVAVAINSIPEGRQQFYRAAYFLPAMVSIAVAGLIWRWFFTTEFGLFNAILSGFNLRVNWLNTPNMAMMSIVIMTLWWTVGAPVIILTAGLKEVPRHYYEAAEIDGANRWHLFRHVTLPLIRPVLFFVVVMNTIGSFQVFGQTFMITGGGPELSTRVMVQYIYEVAFSSYRMGYGSAMSWLLFFVILVFAIGQGLLMRERR